MARHHRRADITDGYLEAGDDARELVTKNAEDFVTIAGVRYFCTGDVGQITPQGQLQIVDRKKDLFKGATGEYVALSKVEAALKLCPYVEMPMAYGKTGEASIIAIIMPQKPNVLEFAKAKGLKGDFAALCTHPDVVAEVSKECAAFCKKGKLPASRRRPRARSCATPRRPRMDARQRPAHLDDEAQAPHHRLGHAGDRRRVRQVQVGALDRGRRGHGDCAHL